MKPIHPGEVLLEVYMKPASPPVTIGDLSRTLSVPQRHIVDLVTGKQTMTRSLAARLGVIFKTTPEYWTCLQRTYDTRMRRRHPGHASRRHREQHRHPSAA